MFKDRIIQNLKAKTVESNDGCWEWQGAKTRVGYPLKRGFLVHRMMWEVFNEKSIPANLVIRHRCDNKSCINPDHLLIGSTFDNIKDRDERRRLPYGEKHWNTVDIDTENTVKSMIIQGETDSSINELTNVHLAKVRQIRRRLI